MMIILNIFEVTELSKSIRKKGKNDFVTLAVGVVM
jgi:hypothetical protein